MAPDQGGDKAAGAEQGRQSLRRSPMPGPASSHAWRPRRDNFCCSASEFAGLGHQFLGLGPVAIDARDHRREGRRGVQCRSRPPAVAQAFVAQPLDRSHVAAAEGAFALLVVVEAAAVGARRRRRARGPGGAGVQRRRCLPRIKKISAATTRACVATRAMTIAAALTTVRVSLIMAMPLLVYWFEPLPGFHLLQAVVRGSGRVTTPAWASPRFTAHVNSTTASRGQSPFSRNAISTAGGEKTEDTGSFCRGRPGAESDRQPVEARKGRAPRPGRLPMLLACARTSLLRHWRTSLGMALPPMKKPRSKMSEGLSGAGTHYQRSLKRRG